jgi:hypothetical protein
LARNLSSLCNLSAPAIPPRRKRAKAGRSFLNTGTPDDLVAGDEIETPTDNPKEILQEMACAVSASGRDPRRQVPTRYAHSLHPLEASAMPTLDHAAIMHLGNNRPVGLALQSAESQERLVRRFPLPRWLRAHRLNVRRGFNADRKWVDEGIWLVSFMHYDLGYFDLEQKTLHPLDNPFGTRLSPMS